MCIRDSSLGGLQVNYEATHSPDGNVLRMTIQQVARFSPFLCFYSPNGNCRHTQTSARSSRREPSFITTQVGFLPGQWRGKEEVGLASSCAKVLTRIPPSHTYFPHNILACWARFGFSQLEFYSEVRRLWKELIPLVITSHWPVYCLSTKICSVLCS